MGKTMIPEILAALFAKSDLTDAQMQGFMTAIMRGEAGEAESAAFLVGLRMKGESAAEIASAARVLREHMIRWDPGRADVLDTCGTGGDGSGTFNISTATALVVAGAGTPIVKHGNRSVSSKSGSADVLAALGVSIDGGPDEARQRLDHAGFAFCFAPNFHPALKHVGPTRKKLGVPTIFNCLGPLANPAGAKKQLLGVGRRDLLDRLADALALLETERALVVFGQDGLDEVTLTGPTLARDVRGGVVTPLEWTPGDFGLPTLRLEDLRADDAQASARCVEGVLRGDKGPALDIVLANAAAALWVAGAASDLREGVARARDAIGSGRAWAVLEKLRTL